MESRDIVLPVGTDISVERGRVGRIVLFEQLPELQTQFRRARYEGQLF